MAVRDGFSYEPEEFPELHHWLREQAARGTKSQAIRDVLQAHVTGAALPAPAPTQTELLEQLLRLLQAHDVVTSAPAALLPVHLQDFGL